MDQGAFETISDLREAGRPDNMNDCLKIVCPPVLCYFLKGVTADDYDALPLLLCARGGGAGFALYRPNGELYTNGDRIDQFRAAKTMRACRPAEKRSYIPVDTPYLV